jgi:hypothetical protein
MLPRGRSLLPPALLPCSLPWPLPWQKAACVGRWLLPWAPAACCWLLLFWCGASLPRGGRRLLLLHHRHRRHCHLLLPPLPQCPSRLL